MSVYDDFKAVIETKDKGIKATYQGQPPDRFLWPKVLGQTNGKDLVLCRVLEEVSGNPGHYSQKHWRCFAVDDLTPSGTFSVFANERPTKFKVRDLRRQSCVDDVDVFR